MFARQSARMQPSLVRFAPPESASSPWLRLDIFLFRCLGAGHGSPALLWAARAVARWSWLPLLGLAVIAVRPLASGGWLLPLCLLGVGLVQWIGKRLARRWSAQRPFALGLCANHLGHGGRAGFPSSHALAMGALLGGLLPFTGAGPLFMAMAALALATGWARVHTGAHFPLDVLSGLALGGVCGLGYGLALLPLLPH